MNITAHSPSLPLNLSWSYLLYATDWAGLFAWTMNTIQQNLSALFNYNLIQKYTCPEWNSTPFLPVVIWILKWFNFNSFDFSNLEMVINNLKELWANNFRVHHSGLSGVPTAGCVCGFSAWLCPWLWWWWWPWWWLAPPPPSPRSWWELPRWLPSSRALMDCRMPKMFLANCCKQHTWSFIILYKLCRD